MDLTTGESMWNEKAKAQQDEWKSSSEISEDYYSL
jgi:hypothetical protein